MKGLPLWMLESNCWHWTSSFFPDARIRFTIPSLLARGILRTHGVYVRFCEGRAISIPLIIFPVNSFLLTYTPLSSYTNFYISRSPHYQKPMTETLARYGVSQALLQAILAYSHYQQLDQYTGFVITVDRTVLRIGRIVASRYYLRSLCSRRPIKEDLLYYLSKPFGLLKRKDRRELLRLLFGVLQCVAKSDASANGDRSGCDVLRWARLLAGHHQGVFPATYRNRNQWKKMERTLAGAAR